MRTWIKICGLTKATDAMLAARLGADALGFVFHAASQRHCDPEAARTIIGSLPPEVIAVGVWLDESADDISALAKYVRCNCVQTYNPVAATQLRCGGFDVIPAIPLGTDAYSGVEWRLLCESWNGPIIVDASRSKYDGAGSSIGLSIQRWRDVTSLFGPNARAILAGSLSADNVHDRLEVYRPAGVDIASGVESGPGRKDPAKLAQYMKEVRRWDAKVGSISMAGNLFQRP